MDEPIVTVLLGHSEQVGEVRLLTHMQHMLLDSSPRQALAGTSGALPEPPQMDLLNWIDSTSTRPEILPGLRCTKCGSRQVFESRWRSSDGPFRFLLTACRCGACMHRFRRWRFQK